VQSIDEQYGGGRDDYGGSSNNGSSMSASASASNWGSSSVPSMPGAGLYMPGYAFNNVNIPANSPNDATSPKLPTIGIGKMSLGSRYDMPRRSVVGLPGDDGNERGDGSEEGERMVVERDPCDIRDPLGRDGSGRKALMVDTMGVKEEERGGRRVVVVEGGGGGDGERERGVCGMDVDS